MSTKTKCYDWPPLASSVLFFPNRYNLSQVRRQWIVDAWLRRANHTLMKSTTPFLLFTLLCSVLSACTALVEADPFPSFDMPSAAAGTIAATDPMPQPDLPATSQPDTGPVTRPMPSPTASDSSSEGLNEMEAAGTGGGAGATQQAEGGAGRDRYFAMSAASSTRAPNPHASTSLPL